MIKYIKGYYAMTFAGGIVVETSSGMGFEINIPAGSPLYKYGEGEEITVFTRKTTSAFTAFTTGKV